MLFVSIIIFTLKLSLIIIGILLAHNSIVLLVYLKMLLLLVISFIAFNLSILLTLIIELIFPTFIIVEPIALLIAFTQIIY